VRDDHVLVKGLPQFPLQIDIGLIDQILFLASTSIQLTYVKVCKIRHLRGHTKRIVGVVKHVAYIDFMVDVLFAS